MLVNWQSRFCSVIPEQTGYFVLKLVKQEKVQKFHVNNVCISCFSPFVPQLYQVHGVNAFCFKA